MRKKKTTLTGLAFTFIIFSIVLWSWHKGNWWLLLGIPFSLLFFSNKETVGRSLGYVLVFVLGNVLYTFMVGSFHFAVWSWFFFLCGLSSFAAASAIFGTEKSNWEEQAKLHGDNRTFEEYEKDNFLNSPEIKQIMEEVTEKYKNND